MSQIQSIVKLHNNVSITMVITGGLHYSHELFSDHCKKESQIENKHQTKRVS